MTRYAFAVDPPILFAYPFVGPDGSTYPANWIDVASPQLRTANNIKAVVEDPAPDGQYIVSETITLDSTVPTAHSVFADNPDPGVPVSITNYQAARELAARGGYEATMSIVSGSNDEPLKAYIAQKQIFMRADAEVNRLRILLAETDEQMDQFFIDASAW